MTKEKTLLRLVLVTCILSLLLLAPTVYAMPDPDFTIYPFGVTDPNSGGGSGWFIDVTDGSAHLVLDTWHQPALQIIPMYMLWFLFRMVV